MSLCGSDEKSNHPRTKYAVLMLPLLVYPALVLCHFYFKLDTFEAKTIASELKTDIL